MHAANIVGDKIDVMKFELHAISAFSGTSVTSSMHASVNSNDPRPKLSSLDPEAFSHLKRISLPLLK
jgi:hypothetical protein